MQKWTSFANVLGDKYNFYVATLGNFLCFFSGMTLAWPSPVLAKLKIEDNPLGHSLSSTEFSLVGSTFSIGGAIGPILLIYSLELLGRKNTILLLAAVFPIFHTVLAFSRTISLYYISRIALGIAAGGSFSVVSIYISEIVSSKMRGSFMSLGTSFVLTGCLCTYSIGPYVPIMTFNLIIAFASLIYIPLFFISCPESLYHTMKKHGTEKTSEILRKLRKGEDISQELEGIKNFVGNRERGSLFDLFRIKAGRRAFFISSCLLVFEQLVGITVVTTYRQTIFQDAHVTIESAISTIIVGAFQTGTCLITPLASKKFGRRSLLRFSFAGLFMSCSLFSLYFYVDFIHDLKWVPLFSLTSFVIFNNCGVGSLPWVVLGELYPLKVKAVGTALSNTLYWVAQIIITFYFPSISMATSFLVFAGFSLVAIAFVQVFLIETKGKTFQEIQNELNK